MASEKDFYKGEEVYKRVYEPPKPNTIPAFTSLHQHEIEKAMYQACIEAGVEFVWDEKVTNVKTSEEGVTVETEKGEWKTKYVIACDGARSVVRNSVGIKFEGPRKSDAFVVVDVAEDEKIRCRLNGYSTINIQMLMEEMCCMFHSEEVGESIFNYLKKMTGNIMVQKPESANGFQK